MPSEKINIRKGEHIQSITKICRIVKDEKVDIILIPGDLIDYESSTVETANYLIDNFSSISPVPVIISPGNHDFYSPSSIYHSKFLVTRRQKSLPENVIVFENYSFESRSLKQCEYVTVTGISHSENRSIDERLLINKIPKEKGKINILVFHGSLDGYCPPDKKVTLPFSREELLSLGFEYAAVGHYHTYSEILDEEDNVKGAYAGCPMGRNLKECGEKFIIIGEIYEDGKVKIEKRKIDNRTIYEIPVNCTGLHHSEAVLNQIEKMVKEKTDNKDDIVYVKLSGRFPPGSEVNIPENFLKDNYFHIEFDKSNIQPDYDIQKYLSNAADTIECKFVKELKSMIEQTQSEAEKKIIENSIYYGLDALTQNSVKPR